LRQERGGPPWTALCAIHSRRDVAITAAFAGTLVLSLARGGPAQGVQARGSTGPPQDGLPLTPTRVVRFQVSTGTWMSLDVSPDGRTIVFDLLGALYTIRISGGKARRLTSGTAINRQPRYSPDGQRLVFVSDRSGSENLWLAERDGAHPRQLSNLHLASTPGAVTSPAWSSDGKTIVVSQRLRATRPGGDAQAWQWLLAAYDVETGRMRWVSDTAPEGSRSALGPALAPGAHTIYAAVDAFRKIPWRDLAAWRIARIDLATGRIEPEMGANVGRVGMRPAVSRDGRYLVYATSSGSHFGFRVRDLRTYAERWLVREVLDDAPYESAEPRDLVPGYAFTADSKALIAAYGGKIHRIELATGRTHVIPFVAEIERSMGPLGIRQFALPDTSVRTRSVRQVALSPDGQMVAFSALDRIWVMDLPHGKRLAGSPRRLTTDSVGEFYPSWSPDGQWITYSTWSDRTGGSLWRARAPLDAASLPGRSSQLTTDTAVYFHTAVTTDGERVVAVRGAAAVERALAGRLEARDLQLVWVPVHGGRRPRVITSLAKDFSLLYRYPVDQMYTTDDPAAINVGLRSWSWDGKVRSDLAVVTRERTFGGFADPDVVGALSPDRCRALIAWDYALFELRLPACGARGSDTLDLERARSQPFGAPTGAARRWGTALGPWASWSRDGRRVVFSQGGTLFVGDVKPGAWTAFERVDVPLMVPVDIPRGTIALRGARLITMRGDSAEVIERGDLVVHDNRIVAVGIAGQVRIPPGARVLNVSGKTILPGYVDIHDHPGYPEGVHPQQRWANLVRLAQGVTAYRDPAPSWGEDVFTYRERERAGDLLGPRIFTTGMPYYGSDPPIQTAEDARERVHANAEYFATETFKLYFDLSTDRRARQLLATAAIAEGLNATAHTNGVELQLASVIDGLAGIEHPSRIRIYDDVATLIARSGTTQTHTYVILPGSLAYMVRQYGAPADGPKMRRFVPPSALANVCPACSGEEITGYSAVELNNLRPLVNGAARIAALGGHVGMGAHGAVPGLGFHWEMWLHAVGGVPNHEILRAATIVGATAIGHARDFGSLESGKLADLQVLDQSPLADIHSTTTIRYVMKNGRLYRGDDLTEIWPRHQPLASIYLWDATGGGIPRADRRIRGNREVQ
jgi:Tol biopolymer transport system component/imidazolonepropionase-like amidohydrolase